MYMQKRVGSPLFHSQQESKEKREEAIEKNEQYRRGTAFGIPVS